MVPRLLFVVGCSVLLTSTSLRAGELPSAADLEFFEKQVRPVLVEHCYKCHGPDQQKAGLRLDSRTAVVNGGESGASIVLGKPDESLLVEAIRYGADGYQMPPDGKLADEKIAALTEWVKRGAPWPADTANGPLVASGFNLEERAKHWSFQPVTNPAIPTVKDAAWPRTSVDPFILQKLESAELKPAAEADKRVLIRRLTFELTGLPPTPEEIDAFLADEAPDAYERLVDRLLASPHYGERWGRHWLDLVRFAETYGHEFDFNIPHAQPYRDYVVRALNDDLPYDQFVTEHVAGDLLKAPRRDRATGYNESVQGTAFYWFSQAKHSPVDIRADECDTVDNQIDVFGKTFLGLTIACARCHDHKFDAIQAKDYYALAGFLQSSRLDLADINPPEWTAEPMAQYWALADRARGELFAAARSALQQEGVSAAFWSSLRSDPEIEKESRSPETQVWKALRGLDGDAFANKRRELARRFAPRPGQAGSADQPVVFADFSDGQFDGWMPAGPAFGTRATVPGDFELFPAGNGPLQWRPLAEGVATSGLVDGRLQGALRSPTFEVMHRFIDLRLARRGGPANPGRQLKNGQVHFIVDGFHLIMNPLYGHLSVNVRPDDRFDWYRIDVSKFIGAKGYLEVLDEGDEAISLDEVVFTNHDRRPRSESNLLFQLLDDSTVTSGEALARVWLAAAAGGLAELSASGASVADETGTASLVRWTLDRLAWSPEGTGASAATAELVARWREQNGRWPQPTRALAITDGSGEDEHLLLRGNPKKLGAPVPRQFLQAFGGSDPVRRETNSGRLELARQLTDPKFPLLSRVIVNRLWMHHFGRGIVPTPDDFGKMGQPPSHPELLDHLAGELVRNDWSLKSIHRLILNSAAYRQSSRVTDPAAEERDPQNVLLHRQNMQRLEGEAIRDAILSLSGRLDDRMYGPSVLPHLTPFMEGRGRPGQSGPLDGDGRRSIYINVRRNFLSPFFLAFDFPTPFTTMGRRTSSNVPAQALTLMNNPFVIEQARLWSERAAAAPTAPEQIGSMFQQAFGRPPTDEERDALVQFIDAEVAAQGEGRRLGALRDVAHVLLNAKEFVFIE